MAGIQAVTGSLRNGLWYRCSDGTLLEPLDVMHLLFPNQGRDTIGDNVCFTPRHFQFPPLRNHLPDSTDYFTPDDFVDTLVTLFVLSVLVTIGMVVCKRAWELLDPIFSSISPAHKKWYVVANLSKSFFLACLAFSTRYWFAAYKNFCLDEFSPIQLKRCIVMYIVTDLVALYMVPKLPRSTIMHHVVTTTLCLIVGGMNLTVKGWGGLLGVCKMTVLYGLCSSATFPVNAYLALRVVYPNSKWLPTLAKISLWTYIVCCAVNWSAHALWLAGVIVNFELSIYTLLYMLAMAVMVNDDVVLIKWLIKRSSPMAVDSPGKETERDEKKQQ